MSWVNIVYGYGYRVYSGLENKTVILLLLEETNHLKKGITHARIFYEDYKRRRIHC